MQVLSKNKINAALDRWGEGAEVYVPMQRGPQSGFFSWKSFEPGSDELSLDVLNVVLPPKNILLPQTEKMYSFQQQGCEVKLAQVKENQETIVIFGVRACDLKAIDCLDQVFLTRGFEDNFYKARREQTAIIANACYKPGPNCFCTSMGVNPRDPGSADVIIRDVGDDYIWESCSEKGNQLSQQIADLLEEKEVKYPDPAPFQKELDYDGVAAKLKDMFEHPLWDKWSQACQACGICTYTCPSCYCFDIQAKSRGEEGYRFRCYDSCMYAEYSQMAGGHNPRVTTRERLRNRFLHKLEFFTERYGRPLCTGCGRCIVLCPTGINIAQVIKDIKEAETGA